MRILFLGNNWVGWQVAKWFKEQDHEVVGLVVHPSSTQQYRDGIATALGLPASQVFDGSRLREPATREAINDLNADIGLSVYFGYILRAEFIDMFEKGIVNLHPGYLPYNKGKHTNVWSILDGTPAGVTLHYINVGIDTGDVIAQQDYFCKKAVHIEIRDSSQA